MLNKAATRLVQWGLKTQGVTQCVPVPPQSLELHARIQVPVKLFLQAGLPLKAQEQNQNKGWQLPMVQQKKVKGWEWGRKVRQHETQTFISSAPTPLQSSSPHYG